MDCGRERPSDAELPTDAERDEYRETGERKHGRACGWNRIAEDPPGGSEISHHRGRVSVRNGGMRHPSEVVINVERGGNELTKLVPEIRQAEVGRVREEDNQNDGGQ
jgi:hypothetical protein